ncbi:MAG: hypothetical protein ACE37H_05480 [Phycisphaeraceae bacterium]
MSSAAAKAWSGLGAGTAGFGGWAGICAGAAVVAGLGSFIVPPFQRITRTSGLPVRAVPRLSPTSSAVCSAARRSISACWPLSQWSIA